MSTLFTFMMKSLSLQLVQLSKVKYGNVTIMKHLFVSRFKKSVSKHIFSSRRILIFCQKGTVMEYILLSFLKGSNMFILSTGLLMTFNIYHSQCQRFPRAVWVILIIKANHMTQMHNLLSGLIVSLTKNKYTLLIGISVCQNRQQFRALSFRIIHLPSTQDNSFGMPIPT